MRSRVHGIFRYRRQKSASWTVLQSVFDSVALYYNLFWVSDWDYNLSLHFTVAFYYNLFLTPWHWLYSQSVFESSDWDYNLSLTLWHSITICFWLRGTLLQSVFESVTGITICLWLRGTLLQSVFDSMALYYNLSFTLWHSITICLWLCGTLLQSVFESVAGYYNLSFILWHSITIGFESVAGYYNLSFILWNSITICIFTQWLGLQSIFHSTIPQSIVYAIRSGAPETFN